MARAGMPPDLAPAAMLAVMWAALANSVPAAFWAAAFLLLPENAPHLAAVLAQLPRDGTDAEAIVQARKPCFLRAIILRPTLLDINVLR
jgi:hypothetical protein